MLPSGQSSIPRLYLLLAAAALALAVGGRAAWVGFDSAYRDDSVFTGLLRTGLALPSAGAAVRSTNGAPFEGGNIGAVVRTAPDEIELNLRSDNDDALPEYWRQWFYLKLTDVPTDRPVTLTIRGAGQWHYYVPFFSYDDRRYTPFERAAVSQPSRLVLRITARFRSPTVWLARFEPYTYSRLLSWLDTVGEHQHVRRDVLGRSPAGREIPVLSITDPTVSGPKARVVLHARTHPGEVGGSFVVEGLVKAALGDGPVARALRRRVIIDVVPMLNVDGVVAGNYRVTPQGVNLEGKWYAAPGDPLQLDPAKTPAEIAQFHRYLLERLRGGPPVTMALNIHSSGGEPRDRFFAFPHFGPRERGYSPAESRLYGRQIAFVRHLADVVGREWLNPPAKDGSRNFAQRPLPETWWWRNFGDQVMALTLEATYGLAGRSGRFILPQDLRRIGAGMQRAIARYHGLDGARGDAPRLPADHPVSSVAAH